ncbi:MAG: metalloregulator ArsR/SmtB family transcription factor [Spirochaetia bacterium]|nr:metalloregulator ArsR/SmtB family transcription factor [Spirochaetia bacterium]
MSEQELFTLRIRKNLAIEMIYSAFYAVAKHTDTHHSDHGYHSQGSRDWLEHLEKTISPFEQRDLELVFSTITARVYLFYLIKLSDLSEPQEVVDALAALDDQQFIDGIKYVIRVPEETTDWLNEQTLIEAYERDWAELSMDFAQEARQLVELLQSPAYFRLRMIEVLSWFYPRYIEPYIPVIDERIDAHVAKHRDLFARDPYTVIDRLTSGNAEVIEQFSHTVDIYPVSLTFDDVSIYMPDQIYIIYSIDHADQLLGQDIHERTDKLIKAIADPKRLEIMRLLRNRVWYSKEIADHLGLTPATVSYHVDLLFQAGLIKIDRPKGRRFYYTLNPKGVQGLISCLAQEFSS